MWMIVVLLLTSFFAGANSQQRQSTMFESSSSEFFVGFVKVPRNRDYNETEIRLHVTTNELDPVTFTVTALYSDFNITRVATNYDLTVVVLPNSLEVESGNLTDRNKGIHIQSEGGKKITVYGSSISRNDRYPDSISDYFLALPCTDLGFDEYNYYGINITGPILVNSVLIVACEDNTIVTTPSTRLVLNRLQTYWFKIQATSKVTTNKPVSFFINGAHEDEFCYNNTHYCDHFIEQQPPTAIWGNTFILTANRLFSSNELEAIVIAAHDSTNLTINCTTYSQPEVYDLEEGENIVNTSTVFRDYCFFQSSSPILVIESFSYSHISYLMLELPVTQYGNNYLLNRDDDNYYDNPYYYYFRHFRVDIVDLFVEPDYYQPERIVMEVFNASNYLIARESNFSTWTEVYCHQSEVCGYAVTMDITYWTTRRLSIKFYHEDSEAKLGLVAYGIQLNDYTFSYSSYAYLGGISLSIPGNVSLTIDCYPQTRTLTCSISGSLISNTNVVWRRNGVVLSIDGINYQQEHVRVDENTTENRLSVLRTSLFLGNFFCAVQCHASSAYKLITTSISTLSAESTDVTEGGIINITCSASVPVPMTLTWLKTRTSNNNALNMAVLNPSPSRVNITTSTQSVEDGQVPVGSCENMYVVTSRLVIHNAEQSDGAMYICQAGDSTARNITINVHPIDNCMDILCQNGGRCIDLFQDFHCDCTGTNHTGRYCEVAEISATERPNVTNVDPRVEPQLLMPVNLTCNATGCLRQTCSYHWYRDGVRIDGEFRSYLYVEQFTPDDRGYYTCEVNNSYGSDTSDSNLLSLQGIRQYLVMVNYSQNESTPGNNIEELRSQISSILLSSEGFNNSAVGYGITEQNITSTGSVLTIPVLLTLNVSNTTSGDQIQQAIRQKLQTAFASANVLSVNVVRFDGCPAVTNESIATSFPNITYSWPETEIGSSVPYSCTCRGILDLEQNSTESQDTVIGTRKCGGSYTTRAVWEPVNIVEDCGLSNITLQLCQTLIVASNNPEIISETLADTTSDSNQIEAVDISVVTTLLETLSTVATTLEEENVTDNFLTTIDNLILANSSELAQSQENSRTSTRLLDILADFSDNVRVSNMTNSITFVQRSYALHVANVDTSSFAGETLTIEIDDEQRNSTIDHSAIVTTPGTDQNISDTVTVAVRMPMTIFQDLGLNNSEMQRLSYTLITEDSLFASSNRSQENLTLVSAVVSVRVNGSENFESDSKLQQAIEVFFQVIRDSTNITCGLWDPKRNNGLGAWSMDSCEVLNRSSSTLDDESDDEECPAKDQSTIVMARYSQPGHFGLLLDVTYGIVEPTPYTFALEVITYLGLPISLICLTIFLITYIATKQLRESGHGQILINMSVALLCLYIMFLIGAHAAPVPPICGISATLLQYFMLVFFGWTGVEAFYLYRKLVKVLGTHIPKFVLKAALIVWLAPLIFVILLAGSLNSYYYRHTISPKPCNTTATNDEPSNNTSSNSPSGFCRAVGPPFWVGTIAPFVLIYIINWVIFILIMVSLYHHARRKLEKDEKADKIKFVKEQLAIGFGLATLFGLGWGFGLVASSTTVDAVSIAFQTIFSIFVTSQGVLFFILHGIKKKEARNQWKLWFAMITRKPLKLYGVSKATNSTYNMSTLPKGSTLPRNIKEDFGSKMVSQTPKPTRKVSVFEEVGQMDKQWSSAPDLDKIDDSTSGEKLIWKHTGIRWERVAEGSISKDLCDSELVITNIDTVEGDD